MASRYDLVSLAALQAWLGQSGDGDQLAALITQISRVILSYLGRGDLLPACYVETRDGDDRSALVLRHWPVLEIAQLLVDNRLVAAAPAPAPGAALGAGYLLDAADRAPPGRMQALSLRGDRFARGRRNVVVSYLAGYRVDAEAAIIPAAPGPYALSAQQPWGPWGSDCGVADSDGATLAAVAAAPGPGEYCVSAGVYVFAPQDAGKAVRLAYGYIPADVAEAAMEWTAERYTYRSRIAQRAKTLGAQETASYDLSPVPGFVAAALQPYRRTAWPC